MLPREPKTIGKILKIIPVVIIGFSFGSFIINAQKKDKPAWERYLKLDATFKPGENNYSLGDWLPAFAVSQGCSMHEFGLSSLKFSKYPSINFYIKTFDIGFRYQYRYWLAGKRKRLKFFFGAAAEMDFFSSHLLPRWNGLYEIKSRFYEYSFFVNSSLSYRLAKKFFIDIDLPLHVWSTRYRYQKKLATANLSGDVSGDWEFEKFPPYQFSFRFGIRYAL